MKLYRVEVIREQHGTVYVQAHSRDDAAAQARQVAREMSECWDVEYAGPETLGIKEVDSPLGCGDEPVANDLAGREVGGWLAAHRGGCE